MMNQKKQNKTKQISSTIELIVFFFSPDGFVSYWISLLDVIQ